MRHNLLQNFDTSSFIFYNSAETAHLVYLYGIYWRMVITLCLSIDIAEAEYEELGIIDAVQFGSKSLDF